MTLAAKIGLDLPTVYDVIVGSAGNSWMFENRVPHILQGDYTPLSAVEIFVKDLGIEPPNWEVISIITNTGKINILLFMILLF